MALTVGSTVEDVAHEGDAIRRLLDAANLTVADLGRACGVTRAAADKYVRAAKLGAAAWETASAGLRKLGLDPATVRGGAADAASADAVSVTRPERRAPELGYSRFLDPFARDQMPALLEILSLSEIEQKFLRVIVQDRISRH